MNIWIDGIIFSLQKQGGVSVYFRHLLDYIGTTEHSCNLELSSPLVQELPSVSPNISISFSVARKLERYRRAAAIKKSSVFHSSYYRTPSDSNIPTVVTVHDFIYEKVRRGPARWVHMTQKARAIRAAQSVICVSDSTRQDLLEWVGEVPGQSVHVIHNGVSDVFRPLSGIEEPTRPFILFVGERAGYKNFEHVLKCLPLIPDIELHCVGGGPIYDGELSAHSESTRRRVRHLGYVSDLRLNELYNAAICLIYPSSFEGFGIPVAEALKAGCPVVSGRCKAVQEIGGDALTVVPDTDPKSYAEAIESTMSSRRHALRELGLLKGAEYSWSAAHRKTVGVYEEISH
jgi:mannosyltransferase